MEYQDTRKDGIVFFLLKNDTNQIYVTNYGATLLSWLVIDRHGMLEDLVLGYETMEEYQTQDGYLGACLGRVANRIERGRFTLNGSEYTLPVNNGPNSLHGGTSGFSHRIFDWEIVNDQCVRFTLVSPDGDQSYPATLEVAITYTLEGDTLSIRYEAQSDADTIVNLSNHSYFNLDGSPSIKEHTLKIEADRFIPVDADGLVVADTFAMSDAMDFRQEKPIKQALDSDDEAIRLGKGIDHPYVFRTKTDPVVLASSKSGLELVVNTSYPQAQIYTANYLDGRPGKHGVPMKAQSAICIETQYRPNDINQDPQSPTILRKGEKYDEWTSFTVRKR